MAKPPRSQTLSAFLLSTVALAASACGSDAGSDMDPEPVSPVPTASGGTIGTTTANTGDPNFLGPFCEGKPRHVIGIATEPASTDASDAEMRQYMLEAVNTIRAMTNLPALKLDDCLNKIASTAIADAKSGGVHGYFKNNCMNAAHNFGKSCECNWAQENYGAAGGSSYTWKDTLNVPVCAMMDEPKGVGHRGNIENKEWTRLGVGILKMGAGSTQWVHEFGR